jgi:hypothetical protein
MTTYQSIEALRSAVAVNGDVLTVEMGDLRRAHGAERLGPHVRRGISDALASHGLGHYPVDLPQYQDGAVRVYRLGSSAADLIKSALRPGAVEDEVLRQAAGGDSADVIRQIRELVCP